MKGTRILAVTPKAITREQFTERTLPIRKEPSLEGTRIQFRAEAFNLTNTPHFGTPGTNVSDMQVDPKTGAVNNLGGYTEIRGTRGNIGRESIDERQFRLGLRIAF